MREVKQHLSSQLTLLPQKKTTFSLPQELYRQLKIASAERDREMSAIVADALRLYLSGEPDER
jgi:metal-responsive CopG/Arc/MetJ family transcriptional regulator